jgi:ubiquinone/menaquinone biosynthesis C-methylase UbiE
MAEFEFRQAAAAGYDRTVAALMNQSIPLLLEAARLAPGHRVLDVATGTGLAAEAAVAVVGPDGSVVAADISRDMVEQARTQLSRFPNVSVAVEDGQALSFPQGSFDAVVCNMGLMFFPDPARGLSEFRRVLRPNGRAAVSVNTTPERSLVTRINVVIGRYVPSLAPAAARLFSLGDEQHLRGLFAQAGFGDVEVFTQVKRASFSSFDAYFEPVEKGGGSPGQAYVTLPEETRRAVREEVRHELGDTGGTIEIEVELRFACGRR